jgi:hypothetical protein
MARNLPWTIDRYFSAAVLATPGSAYVASPQPGVIGLVAEGQIHLYPEESTTLLFQSIKLFSPLISAIVALGKWRTVLVSLRIILCREAFGQQMFKPPVVDDDIAPERRV